MPDERKRTHEVVTMSEVLARRGKRQAGTEGAPLPQPKTHEVVTMSEVLARQQARKEQEQLELQQQPPIPQGPVAWGMPGTGAPGVYSHQPVPIPQQQEPETAPPLPQAPHTPPVEQAPQQPLYDMPVPGYALGGYPADRQPSWAEKTLIETGKAGIRETGRIAQSVGGSGVEMLGQLGADAAGWMLSPRPPSIPGIHVPMPEDAEPVTFRNPFEGQRKMAQETWGKIAEHPKLQPDESIQKPFTDLFMEGDYAAFGTKLIAESIGILPSQIPVMTGYAVGGPVAAGLVGGALEAFGKYEELLQEGYDIDEAASRAGMYGIGTIPLNMVSFSGFSEKYLPKNLRGMMLATVLDAVIEGATESAEGSLDPLIRMNPEDIPTTLGEFKQLLKDMYQGLIDESGVFIPASTSGLLIYPFKRLVAKYGGVKLGGKQTINKQAILNDIEHALKNIEQQELTQQEAQAALEFTPSEQYQEEATSSIVDQLPQFPAEGIDVVLRGPDPDGTPALMDPDQFRALVEQDARTKAQTVTLSELMRKTEEAKQQPKMSVSEVMQQVADAQRKPVVPAMPETQAPAEPEAPAEVKPTRLGQKKEEAKVTEWPDPKKAKQTIFIQSDPEFSGLTVVDVDKAGGRPARYLEVTQGRSGRLIARRWRAEVPRRLNLLLIDTQPKNPHKYTKVRLGQKKERIFADENLEDLKTEIKNTGILPFEYEAAGAGNYRGKGRSPLPVGWVRRPGRGAHPRAIDVWIAEAVERGLLPESAGIQEFVELMKRDNTLKSETDMDAEYEEWARAQEERERALSQPQVDLFGNEIVPEQMRPEPEMLFDSEPVSAPQKAGTGQEDLFVGEKHDPSTLPEGRNRRMVEANNKKIADLRKENTELIADREELAIRAHDEKTSRYNEEIKYFSKKIADNNNAIDTLLSQNDQAVEDAKKPTRLGDKKKAAPEKLEAHKKRAEAKDVASRVEAIDNRIDLLERTGKGKTGKMRPSIQKQIDALMAERDKIQPPTKSELRARKRAQLEETIEEAKANIEDWQSRHYQQSVHKEVNEARRAKRIREFESTIRDAERQLADLDQPTPKPPPAFGESNVVVTKAEADAAKARLKDLMGDFKKLGIVPENPVPDIFRELATVGMYYFEAGARKFTQWNRQMIHDFGEDIAKYTRRIWRATAEARAHITQTEKQIALGRKKAASPEAVRKRVREIITRKEGEQETFTSKNLLKYAMKHQERAAKAGYRAGKQEATASFKQMADDILAEVREALPKDDKGYNEIAGRVMRAARAQSAVALQNAIDSANKYMKQRAAAAGKKGFKAGQKEIVGLHTRLAEFAKKHLPKEDARLVARVLDRVARTRTNADLKRVMIAVNTMAKNYQKQQVINEYKEAVKEAKSKKWRPEFKRMVDEITSQFSLSTPSDKVLARIKSLMDAVGKDDIGEIPQQVIDAAMERLKDMERMPVHKLDVEGIRTVTNAIRSLINQNDLKNRLWAGRKYQTIKDTVKKAVDEIAAVAKKDYSIDSRSAKDRLGKKPQAPIVKALTSDQASAVSKLLRLVGDKGSATLEVFVKNINKAHEAFSREQKKAREYVSNLISELGLENEIHKWSRLTGKKPDFVSVEIGGKKVTMTRAERVELLCHIADPSTRAELLKGTSKGVVFRMGESGDPIKLTAKDLRAIRDSASAKEHAFAKGLMGYLNSSEFTKAINKTWLDLFGFELITRNDHFPRRRSEEHKDATPNDILEFWQAQRAERSLEGQSIFKERVGGNEPIIIGDIFSTFQAHVSRGAAFATKTKAVHDALAVLGDLEFRKAVRKSTKHGNALLSDLEAMVKAFQGQDLIPLTSTERAVSRYIRNLHSAWLLLKVHIPLYQPLSYLAANTEVDAKYLAKGASNVTKNTRAEMYEHSAALWARAQGAGDALMTANVSSASVMEFWDMKKGALGRAREKLFGPIRIMDAITIDAIWEAVKLEGRDKGLSGDALMEYTSDRAAEVVYNTQPSSHIPYVSMVALGAKQRPLMKFLTLFKNQQNKNLNLAVQSYNRFVQSEKTASDYAHLVKNLTMSVGANAVLAEIIRKGTRAFIYRDDKDDWTDFFANILARMFGGWLGAGEVIDASIKAAKRGHDGKSMFYGTRMPESPIARILSELVEGFYHAGKLTSAAINKGEIDEAAAKKLAHNLFNFMSMGVGLPGEGAEMIGKGIQRHLGLGGKPIKKKPDKFISPF